MKRIGIWIDKDKAHVVILEHGKEHFKTLPSNIEHFRPRGGSGTRLKGGPQDVVQDSKYLEREKHQFREYFKTIIEEIEDADAIVIYGPAGSNEKLAKEIERSNKVLSSKVKAVIKADSMTDNQTKALVKEFYGFK